MNEKLNTMITSEIEERRRSLDRKCEHLYGMTYREIVRKNIEAWFVHKPHETAFFLEGVRARKIIGLFKRMKFIRFDEGKTLSSYNTITWKYTQDILKDMGCVGTYIGPSMMIKLDYGE